MNTEKALALAIQVIAASKAYDPSCGGSTQFLLVGDDGSHSSLHGYDITSAERLLSHYEFLNAQLLMGTFNTSMEDAAYRKLLNSTIDQIDRIRMEWKKDVSWRERAGGGKLIGPDIRPGTQSRKR